MQRLWRIKNFASSVKMMKSIWTPSHAYYFQVQTQLYVCNVAYCDFVVCTFSDEDGLHVERLEKNFSFWSECVLYAEVFFRYCVLPELLAKWYTKAQGELTVIDEVGVEEIAATSEVECTSEEGVAITSELLATEVGVTTTSELSVEEGVATRSELTVEEHMATSSHGEGNVEAAENVELAGSDEESYCYCGGPEDGA